LTEDVHDGEEHKYKQSFAINELLFDRASPLDHRPNGPRADRAAGTVYPAMQMKGAADNAAIFPEFVDSSLRLVSVGYARVEAADEARSSYTILTEAMSHEFRGQEIIWSPTIASEAERRSHIAFENGEWLLRDGHGKIYDRH
jgi:hypothetical protein